MAFSKIRLGIEEIFTTTVQDETGREIDRWKCLKKDFYQVIKILNNKFGLNLKIKEKAKDRDLDWALK